MEDEQEGVRLDARVQTDYQSLGSARPREPVNTEIMQRDNSSPSSPISSDNAPQDLHEERNAEERSGEG